MVLELYQARFELCVSPFIGATSSVAPLVLSSSPVGSLLILVIPLVLIVRAEASNVSFSLAIETLVFVAKFALLVFTEFDVLSFNMDQVGAQAQLIFVVAFFALRIWVKGLAVIVVAMDVKLRHFVLILLKHGWERGHKHYLTVDGIIEASKIAEYKSFIILACVGCKVVEWLVVGVH
jgi:hypothetical protein